MFHRPASSQLRLAGRHVPHIRRTLGTLAGLAVFVTAAIGFAPTASATPAPPEPSFAPVPPPPPPLTVPAHFPPWVIAAILAATIALSVATTLITLALEHAQWARREAAAIAEPQASAPTPFTTPAHQAEILSIHRARDRA